MWSRSFVKPFGKNREDLVRSKRDRGRAKKNKERDESPAPGREAVGVKYEKEWRDMEGKYSRRRSLDGTADKKKQVRDPRNPREAN